MIVMNDFDKALDVIHEKGWIKGMLRDHYGHVCLVGSLDVVLKTYDLASRIPSGRAWSTLYNVCQSLYPERGDMPYKINDHPDTTLEDVELILKHASYEWEATHNAE